MQSSNLKRDEFVKEILEFVNHYDGGFMEPYVAEKLLEFLEDRGNIFEYTFDND